MKRIPLTRGKFALVDNIDYPNLILLNWYAHLRHGTWYSSTSLKDEKGKFRIISMHRYILNLKHGDGKIIDHKDHNGLNNQRNNLRICNKKQNLANRKAKKYGKSKYLGVYFSNRSKKWRAATRGGNGKTKAIGIFKKEKEAALAYNIAAKMYYGNFANLNNIGKITTNSLLSVLHTLQKIDKNRGSKEVLKERRKLINFIKKEICLIKNQ